MDSVTALVSELYSDLITLISFLECFSLDLIASADSESFYIKELELLESFEKCDTIDISLEDEEDSIKLL
jgi:hypothetical protein